MLRFFAALLFLITLAGGRAWAQQNCGGGGLQLIQVAQIFSQAPSGSMGFLGIRIGDIDDERAKALKLGDERGIEVKAVMEGSAADNAGILPGDVLLTYNGETLLSAEQFTRMVRETPPGRKVKVQYWRSGKTHMTVLTVGAAGNSSWSLELPKPSWPKPPMDLPRPLMVWRNSTVGIDFEHIDSQLAEYFGVKGGILIRFVERGSAADKAGMRAGDVVFSVAQQTLSSEHDFSTLLKEHGTSVPVSLMRDHKRIDLVIALPQ
ncbi:MAG: PDZ domain-containing protein [Acidobacteriaceae bacterium]|nr:PDZ domain-containing protein [Acidobacteriaceae bacterium]